LKSKRRRVIRKMRRRRNGSRRSRRRRRKGGGEGMPTSRVRSQPLWQRRLGTHVSRSDALVLPGPAKHSFGRVFDK
jgi:hypothetical protein